MGDKGPWEPYSWPSCKRWLFCRRRTAMCEAPSLEQIHDITGNEADAKSRWEDSASMEMWGVVEQALRLGCDYMFQKVLSEGPGVSLSVWVPDVIAKTGEGVSRLLLCAQRVISANKCFFTMKGLWWTVCCCFHRQPLVDGIPAVH